MRQWIKVVPKPKGAYFYRPEEGMPSAIVECTAEGFLFHGVERVVAPRNMVGEFWSEPIQPPENS